MIIKGKMKRNVAHEAKHRIETFEPALLIASGICLALANPTKMLIAQLLSKNGEMTVGQLTVGVSGKQATISQHLNMMKQLGLLGSRDYKTSTVYFLNRNVLEDLKLYLNGI